MKYLFSHFTYYGAYHVKEYFNLGRDRLGIEERRLLTKLERKRPFVRALAVWGMQAGICYQEAQAAFGERYHLLRYEDFCEDAAETIHSCYRLINLDISQEVKTYANNHIHANRLTPWKEVLGAVAKFRKGTQLAGIADFAKSLGYE